MSKRPSTILALSTPPGRSAIAVLRMSGPAVPNALQRFGLTKLEARRAVRHLLRDEQGVLLDEAIVIRFAAPASYTGEELAEFHLHGSRAVVRRVLEVLLSLDGVRLAEPGEFTRRAVDAGKMNLLEAEALGDLIDSETEQQRLQAVRALGGGLLSRVDMLREQIVDLSAVLAASIDFSDEDDVPEGLLSDLRDGLMSISAGLQRLLSGASSAEIVRDGLRVALLGPPNAGKSSLLNVLAGRDAAIVSDIPGTTRDRVEVSLELDGHLVTVVDTAGLRDSTDAIERLGMARSLEAGAEAHLVIWLEAQDAASPVPEALQNDRLIRVRSKSDLEDPASFMNANPFQSIAISTLLPEGLESLLSALRIRLRELVGQDEVIVVARERQRLRLKAALNACNRALTLSDSHPELLAEELNRVAHELDALIGRVGVEDVLDSVFSRFCIGK